MKTIEIYEKQNYGQTAIYATGPIAEPIARLTGRKTLTKADIQALQNLGFEFEWVLNPQTLTNRAFYAGRRAA